MANHIVGIDFGTHSIQLIEVDHTGDPVVVTNDEERLPPGDYTYLPGREAPGEATDDQGDDESPERGGEEETRDEETDDESIEASSEVGGAEPVVSAPWIEALDALLNRHEFPPETKFLTFLPQGRAISIHVDVPFDDRDKVDDILPNLLEDRLPIDPEEVVYDFRIIGDEDGDQHRAVVGLGRSQDIGAFLNHLAEADFNPAVLGIPELMLRYVAGAAVPDHEVGAVLDLGHRTTRVVVVEEGDAVMARSIDTGGADVTEAIARKFEMSAEQAEHYKEQNATAADPNTVADREASAVAETVRGALRPLVRDLRRNFQSLYARNDIELDSIYVCGGTSRVDGIEGYLESQLGVPVGRLNLQSAIEWGVLEGQGDPRAALALSMALQPVRDASETFLHNLRKDKFAYRGGGGIFGENSTRWLAVAATLMVLFFGGLFAERYRLSAEAQALEGALGEQSQKLFGREITDPSLVQELAAGGADSERAYVPKMSAYELYYELMSKAPEDIKLELNRIDVDTDRNVIQMSGITNDPQTVDELVSSFEKLECLENINKKPVRVESEDEARFELEISSRCS